MCTLRGKNCEEDDGEDCGDTDADDEHNEGDKDRRQEVVKMQQLEIRSVNITSLLGSQEILAEMQGHLIFLQETAATKAMARKVVRELKRKGGGCLCPPSRTR